MLSREMMLQRCHWSEPKATILCWRRCSKTWRLRQSQQSSASWHEGRGEMKTSLSTFSTVRRVFSRGGGDKGGEAASLGSS